MKHLSILLLLIAPFQGAFAQQDTTAAKTLKEVTVTAMIPFVVQKTGKVVLNVAQSPLAAGSNVYDVILRAPGVTDQQGLQFRGRPVAVYVNDRPVRLSGGELQAWLSAMPAGTVEKVEVIADPSARYEAAGNTVINIILAKSKDLGANATITAGFGAGTYLRYNGGLSLNYRGSKLNVYGSYDRMHTKSLHYNYVRRYFGAAVISDGQRTKDGADNNTFKAGLDYHFNAGSSTGVQIRGVSSNREKDIHVSSTSSSVDTRATSSLFTPAVNLYYRKKLGSKGGELTWNMDYFSYSRRSKDDFVTRYFDEKGQPSGAPYLLRDNSPAGNRVWSVSADYSVAARSIQLEAGLKMIATKTDNNALWQTFSNESWENDNTRSNHFIYCENIYAAYASATRSIRKIELRAGLRMEHTVAEGRSLTISQVNRKHYTNLFPNLNVTFNQSDKQQFSISYRRKIERFGFGIVNPFIIYQSRYAAYQGNPEIRPSFSHNFEAAWAYDNEWMASFSYSRYTDALAEVYRKNSAGDVMISTYENVAGASQLGLNITHTKNLLNNKLVTSNTFGGLHARYSAPDSTGLNSASYTAFLSSNNMLMLAKHWKAELNAFFYSPMRFGAYHFRSQFAMSIGISRSLFSKNGSLSLSVTDLLNTNKRRYDISSYNVRSFNRSNPETRLVKLAFTYRFGNRQVKALKNRKTGIEEVQRRMEE